MKNEVLKDWKTEAGLRAVALRTEMGHLCGYVAVDENHPWYEKDYSFELDQEYWEHPVFNKTFKGSPIDLLIAAGDKGAGKGPQISYFISVHGGVTYSGGNDNYPVEHNEKLWWFGFDCNHHEDTQEKCNLEFVIKECESLAEQLNNNQKENKE